MTETTAPNLRLTQKIKTLLTDNGPMTSTATQVDFNTSHGDMRNEFNLGLHLISVPGTTNTEYINVTDVSFVGGRTRLTFERTALSNLGITNAAGNIGTTTILAVLEVTGDTVYGTDGNKLYKITEKKIYNSTTEELYIIDSTGKIVYTDTTCLR